MASEKLLGTDIKTTYHSGDNTPARNSGSPAQAIASVGDNVDLQIAPATPVNSARVIPSGARGPAMSSTKYFIAPEFLLPHDKHAEYTAYAVRWSFQIQNYEYQINGFNHARSEWATEAQLGIPAINYFSGKPPKEVGANCGIIYDPNLRCKVVGDAGNIYTDFLVIFAAIIVLGGLILAITYPIVKYT